MPFKDARPPVQAAGPGTGVSISLTINKAGNGKVRLTLREDVQSSRFGGPIAGQRFSIQIGRGCDEGRLRIARDDNGAFEARSGIKGGATLYVAAWDLLPKSPRKAEPCKMKPFEREGELILDLPDFCRPSRSGGRMDQEFGLKKVK
ncbi:hypothetical protein [Mameliella alba]|uniref:Uncharacterized protein n=1 Tax=Mameliella alba TaxID=561184 RepID=A0A0B3S370_9RHOB|nr:hypothetical protein [Mameliella alba]KHQ51126.1 hypothetical protein OA50_04497 [Mameliella alba]